MRGAAAMRGGGGLSEANASSILIALERSRNAAALGERHSERKGHESWQCVIALQHGVCQFSCAST